MRNGIECMVPVNDILVGDILIIRTGERLPVDGVLVTSQHMMLDESALTGEAEGVYKGWETGESPFVLSGSQVLEGTGTLLVLAVGELSFSGRQQMLLAEESETTPLQRKLEQVAEMIGYIGVIMAVLTLIGLYGHFTYDAMRNPHYAWTMSTVHELLSYLIIGISIIICAVPEGLPLAVTLCLAFSVGKMRQQNNLVRHLDACETLGGANDICSDKTGTLTRNEMKVVRVFASDTASRVWQCDKYDLWYNKKSVEYIQRKL